MKAELLMKLVASILGGAPGGLNIWTTLLTYDGSVRPSAIVTMAKPASPLRIFLFMSASSNCFTSGMRAGYGNTERVTCQTVKPPSAPAIFTKKEEITIAVGVPVRRPSRVRTSPGGKAPKLGAFNQVNGTTPPVLVSWVV